MDIQPVFNEHKVMAYINQYSKTVNILKITVHKN